MNKFTLIAVSLIFMLITPALVVAASPDYTVHVKKGDWIKYNVKETGTPTPEFNITWGRMDIKSVEGEAIHTDVLTGYANGTVYPENDITLNIATGAIGDGFFIPINLQPGDKYNSGYEGNITITGFEQIEAGGAQAQVATIENIDLGRTGQLEPTGKAIRGIGSDQKLGRDGGVAGGGD